MKLFHKKIFGIDLFEWLVDCLIDVIFSLPWIIANSNIIYFMVLEALCLRLTL